MDADETSRASRFVWAWCLTWGAAAGLGVVTAHFVPEASYLFVVPALLAALSGAAVAWSAHAAEAPGAWARALAALSPAAFVAVFAGGLLAAVPELVGIKGVLVSALPKAAVAVALFPLWLAEPPARGRRWGLGWATAAALMFGVELFAFASAPPRPVASTLRLHDDRSAGVRRLIVFGELPPELASGGAFERQAKVFPWSSGQRPEWVATTTIAGGLAPELRELTVTATTSGRLVQAKLHSPRGAARALVAIPPGAPVSALRIEGVEAEVGAKGRRASGGWRVISVATFPPEGLALQLKIEGDAPVELFLSDESYDLPPPLRALAARRPAHAVPAHMGDSTTITISTRL